MPSALLIVRQALFAPYFCEMLGNAGLRVTVARSALVPKRRAMNPALVVLDASSSVARPLVVIERVRTAFPQARLIVFTQCIDPLWNQLAVALGADAIIDPIAEESDFLAAIGVHQPGF